MTGMINWQLLLPALLLRGIQVGPTGRPTYNLAAPIAGFLQTKALEQLMSKLLADQALMTAPYVPAGMAAATGTSLLGGFPLSLLFLIPFLR